MQLDFSRRSTEEEQMDDLEMTGPELAVALDQLRLINAFLGGHTTTIGGLKRLKKLGLLSKASPELVLVDVGCGGGDTLRAMAEWARKEQIPMRFVGIDANAYTVAYAQNQLKAYPEIEVLQGDIFSNILDEIPHHILTFNLVLHHFPTETLQTYLPLWCNQAQICVLINDLQRHLLPYFLYQFITRLLGASRMVRQDGSLSIRKGFTQTEWKQLLHFCPLDKREIRWRWAFRHQLVIYPHESHIS